MRKSTPTPDTQHVSAPTAQINPKPVEGNDFLKSPKHIGFQSVAPSAKVLARFLNNTPTVKPVATKQPSPKPAPQKVPAIVPPKAKNSPAKKVPQKQPTKQQTKTPATIPVNKPEPKVSKVNKQINALFESQKQIIVNLDDLVPTPKFPKVARQLWDIRDFSFSFMGKLGACNETNESPDSKTLTQVLPSFSWKPQPHQSKAPLPTALLLSQRSAQTTASPRP